MDKLAPDVIRVAGVIGARSQGVRAKYDQTNEAAQTTEVFLSEVRDLDYTDAITNLEASMTQLEASLRTSAIVSNLSLLDFLR